MTPQEQRIKQLEAAIIMRKAELWQLTCDIRYIKSQISAKQAEEAQLVAQLNQLRLTLATQPEEVEKLDENVLKPKLVDRPITPLEGREN